MPAPIRLLRLLPPLLPLGRAGKAGAKVGAATGVDIGVDTAPQRGLGARRRLCPCGRAARTRPSARRHSSDLVQAESGEAREPRRIGLCDLREALSSTRPVRIREREKVGRWTHAR